MIWPVRLSIASTAPSTSRRLFERCRSPCARLGRASSSCASTRSPGVTSCVAASCRVQAKPFLSMVDVERAGAQTRSPVASASVTTAGTTSPTCDRPIPARVLEAVDRVPLGEDVALRLAEAAPLVDAPQPVVERAVGGILQLQVERGLDAQAVLVELLRAVARFELLAHFLDEVRRRRSCLRRRRRAATIGCCLRRRRPRFGVMKPLVGHPLRARSSAAASRAPCSTYGLCATCLEDAGDERRFVEGQVLRGLAEVEPRRRLDAVGAVAEVHLVAVEREDLALGVALLDLDGERSLP